MEYKVEHKKIPFKSPNMTAYIESYESILERECFYVYEFRTYAETYEEVARFLKFYNSKRINGSIHWLSPEEYHQRVLNRTIKGIEITA
nr:IS3 family transposase [Lutispora thermophila]